MQRWARRLVGGGVMLVVAGAGLWASAAGPASGAGTPLVSVSPASQNVALGGDLFKVNIAIDNVENLGGFEITMTFNHDVLEYIGIARGPFLSSTGRTATCVSPLPGPNGTRTPVENVNQNGAFHFGCYTRGLGAANDSIPGPSGGGVLMTVGFKAKAPGIADLVFRGTSAIQPPDATPVANSGPFKISVDGNDNGEFGFTGVANALGDDVLPDMQGGVVQVYDPNAPAPTAVPATPTVVVAPPPQGNRQATSQAILGGRPERRLDDGTPIVGASNSSGGSVSVGGSGSDSGGSSGGGVAGASSGGATGASSTGGPTGSIAQGSSGGTSAGGSRSASGAPRAGFGPDARPGNPWPGRVSLALILIGVGAVITGAASKRERVLARVDETESDAPELAPDHRNGRHV